MSKDAVDAAKKKMGAPSGAPPAGLAAVMAKIKSAGPAGGGGGRRDDDAEDDDDLFDQDYGKQYEKPTSRSKPVEDERPPQRVRRDEDDRRHRYDDDDSEDVEYDDRGRSDRDGRRDNNGRDRGYDDRRDHDRDENSDRDHDDWRDGRGGKQRAGKDSRRRGSRDDEDEEDEDDDDRRRDDDHDDDDENSRRRGGGWSNSAPAGRGRGAPSQPKSDAADKVDAKDSWAKADSRGAKSTGAAPSSSSNVPAAALTVSTASNVTLTATGAKPTAPGKPPSFNFQPILKATYRELRTFVMTPAGPGVVTRCYIERSRKGEKMFAPVYSLCADLEDGTGRELLVCRKVMKSMTSHYVFSLKQEDLYRPRDQRSRLFLGKLRATNSNEYVLYDNGATKDASKGGLDNDDDDDEDDVPGAKKGSGNGARDAKDDRDMNLFRKELAVIFYNTKKRPAPLSVRGTEVCVGAVNKVDKAEAKVSGGKSEASSAGAESMANLSQPFQKIRGQAKQNEMNKDKCYIMHERTSRYDPLSSCLVDFKGRANMASVKNFQLVHSAPQELQGDGKKAQELDSEKEYILQLGKTTEECFNMDYRHPLSMLQAFAICIARFDAKLSW